MEESFIRRGDVAIDVQKVTSDSEKSLTSPISVYGNYNQLEYTTVEYDDFTNISEYTIQYEYDANGNMIEKTSFDEDYLIESLDTYTFDIFGRMTQSTNDGIATTYTYDGDNLRASKTTNGVTTNHILDGMNVVADITGSTTNSYSRGLSLYASKKGTQTFSYTTNIHGDNQTDKRFCFFVF